MTKRVTRKRTKPEIRDDTIIDDSNEVHDGTKLGDTKRGRLSDDENDEYGGGGQSTIMEIDHYDDDTTTDNETNLQTLIIDLQRLLYAMECYSSGNDAATANTGSGATASNTIGASNLPSWRDIIARADMAESILKRIHDQVNQSGTNNTPPSTLNEKEQKQLESFERRVKDATKNAKQIASEIRTNDKNNGKDDIVDKLFGSQRQFIPSVTPTSVTRTTESVKENDDTINNDINDDDSNANIDEEVLSQQDTTIPVPKPPVAKPAVALVTPNKASSTNNIEDIQTQQREQMEAAIAQMASQMKMKTAALHNTIKKQTDILLTDMENIAEENVVAVTELAKDTNANVRKSWSKSFSTWITLLIIIAMFIFGLLTILMIPKRPTQIFSNKRKVPSPSQNTVNDWPTEYQEYLQDNYYELEKQRRQKQENQPHQEEDTKIELANTSEEEEIIASENASSIVEENQNNVEIEQNIDNQNENQELTDDENQQVDETNDVTSDETSQNINTNENQGGATYDDETFTGEYDSVYDDDAENDDSSEEEMTTVVSDQQDVSVTDGRDDDKPVDQNWEEEYTGRNEAENKDNNLNMNSGEQSEEDTATSEIKANTNVDSNGAAPYQEVVQGSFQAKDIAYAAAVGNHNLLRTYLLNKPEWVNVQDENGWAPIHEASLRGQAESVRILIEHGSSVSLRTKDQLLPLDIATNFLVSNHPVILLLTRAIDLQPKQKDDECVVGPDGLCIQTPGLDDNFPALNIPTDIDMRESVLREFEETRQSAQKLSTAFGRKVAPVPGEDSVNTNNKHSRNEREVTFSTIQFRIAAISSDSTPVLKEYIETLQEQTDKNLLKAFLNEPDEDGWTALHLAVDGGVYDNVKLLLSAGADYAVVTRFTKNTPLDIAYHKYGGDDPITQLLEEYEEMG